MSIVSLLLTTPLAVQRRLLASGRRVATKVQPKQAKGWAHLAPRESNPLPRRRTPVGCRATAEKEGVQQDDKLQVPDAPPGKGAPAPEEPTASTSGVSSTNAEVPLSAEEIQRQMGELRAAKAESASKDGLVDVGHRGFAFIRGSVGMKCCMFHWALCVPSHVLACRLPLQGVLEEVRLIKWPSPKSALLNTLLVIAIVAGTSALLFGVNALLAEVSAAVYSRS